MIDQPLYKVILFFFKMEEEHLSEIFLLFETYQVTVLWILSSVHLLSI